MWIGDVFGRERAEGIEIDDIAAMFHRSREMDVLERPENHVILGAKGSGKSTVLKALTLPAWKQRVPGVIAPFAGVYLPMSFDDVNIFRTTFDERQTTDTFEHFLVLSVLYRLIQQTQTLISEQDILELLSRQIKRVLGITPKNIADLSAEVLDARFRVLAAVRADPAVTAISITPTNTAFSGDSLQELAEQFLNLSTRVGGLPPKLGVLLDSFDYYGPVGAAVSRLLQSDSGVPLVVKLAARTLNVRDVFNLAGTRRLEPDRDFQLISLDRNTDSAEHVTVVRETICRRARRLGPDGSAALSDERIVALLFDGAGSDPGDLSSFESFCRLSSGNVLAVILLLDKAAEIQRRAQPDPLPFEPIRRDHRLRAIEEMSQEFDLEIGVRLPTQKLEASTFCDVALAYAKQHQPGENRSPSFALSSLTSEKSLIANMLATRVLTAADPAVNLRVQAGFEVPARLEFELNRLLLPRQQRLPIAGGAVELERASFESMYKKALKAAKPHLSPRSARHQRELFRTDFSVFISMPLDPSKRERTTVLRKAISRIYKERTGRDGVEGIAFVDIHYIPHAGPFRTEIPGYIREATYVIADISDIGVAQNTVPGVFYEIGAALGEKKPIGFFYNCRGRSAVPQFRTEFLPPVLRDQSVLIWDNRSESFFKEFSRVHEKLAAFNGTQEFPADAQDSREGGREYAFLSFEPRNARAREWFSSVVHRLYPDLQIVFSENWQADDTGRLYHTVANASLCIIDCTGKINSQAIELGLAAATGGKRTIEVWDSANERTVNPVAMFPGQKWAWTDLGTDDERDVMKILNDVGRATLLGSRRL